MLETKVFMFKLTHAFDIRGFHITKFATPFVICGAADAIYLPPDFN
ncbi:MAG: hypothetical protein ACIAQZ_04805 [Sedimentisphaeraceae bacterium JB056]